MDVISTALHIKYNLYRNIYRQILQDDLLILNHSDDDDDDVDDDDTTLVKHEAHLNDAVDVCSSEEKPHLLHHHLHH